MENGDLNSMPQPNFANDVEPLEPKLTAQPQFEQDFNAVSSAAESTVDFITSSNEGMDDGNQTHATQNNENYDSVDLSDKNK